MKIPYLMENTFDCGPRCIRSITGLDYETIVSKWPGGWNTESDRGPLGSPNDTPWDHFTLLESLDLKYSIIDRLENLKQDDIVLLHSNKETLPEWWPISIDKTPKFMKNYLKAIYGTLGQHWAIFSHYTEESAFLYMGKKDELTEFNRNDFDFLYSVGWPNCAYRIGEGDHKTKSWHRYVAILTGSLV